MSLTIYEENMIMVSSVRFLVVIRPCALADSTNNIQSLQSHYCNHTIAPVPVKLCEQRAWVSHYILQKIIDLTTVYTKKYAHGFVVICFVVVMQSFIMNSHEVFIHIHQGCFAGTGAIARLPQCQWSKPDGYGKISQCITTTKHSKAKTVCIFLGIYCIYLCQHFRLFIWLRGTPESPQNWWFLYIMMENKFIE